MATPPKAGLFGIGLDTYWPQFDGLRDRLTGYQDEVAARLASCGADVHDAGLVDDPDRARAVGDELTAAGVDVVFLYIATYALSHTVLPVVQRLRAPVVVLNLQPVAAIDYDALNALGDRGRMTGEWLAHCQACVAPEIANVFRRARLPFRLVTGYLAEDYVWTQVGEYVRAVGVAAALRQNRVGVMGHYYNGMLDVYADLTRLAATFGCHFELLEFGQLKALRAGATQASVTAKRAEFAERFDVSPLCTPPELDRAARTAAALDALVAEHRLDALAYYYEGSGDAEAEQIVTSVIAGFTLLTGAGVPVAGECEVKNALAMKILDLLGAGGSFSEPYALDFADDVVLWGHDGPAHPRIADGPVGLVPVPVYHGKPGRGLSIQMSVAHGPVTLLSVCEGGEGEVYLLVAEGESVPGPTLQIGNTNSRYRFGLGARAFTDAWTKAGPAHHCAIGVGHLAGVLRKLGELLGVGVVEV